MIVNHYGGDFYLAQILWLCFIFYSGGGSDRVFYKWICAISCYCYTAAFIIYFFLPMTKNKSNDYKNQCSYFIRTESVILCKYYARSTLPDLKQDVQT